jgi:NADH-quinone oxidoreductase subunit E
MKNTKRDIETYKQKIKKRGFRLTETRMVILDVLLKSSGEMDAEELFLLSHKKYQKIGMATIYRTLRLLEKEGLLTKFGFENNKAKYRIEESPELAVEKPDIRPSKNGLDKKKFTGDAGYPLVTGYEGNLEDYRNVERINTIQNQLSQWLGDLNKIKREKELALEDVIKDFGKVDKIVSYHENQRSNLIQILLDVQNEYRWLPKHVLLYISNRLDIPLSNIYDITTFYKYFNLEPQGRHSIIVCVGTACHIRGAMNLLQRIVNTLKIKPGDTTSDYNFTLNTVNCLGCCALGPVMMVDNKYFSNPSTGMLKKILKQFY